MISSNQRVTHSQIEEVHTFGRGGIKMANSSKWHTRWKPRRYHRIYYSKCVFSFHRLCVCYILARLFLFILSSFFSRKKQTIKRKRSTILARNIRWHRRRTSQSTISALINRVLKFLYNNFVQIFSLQL